MKKLYYIILAAAFSACANQLDIKPQQSLDETVAMSNDLNIRKALIGAYDGLNGYSGTLATANFGYMWGGNAQLYSELLAANGEISWVGTFNQPREVFGKRILVNNGYVANEWSGSYYVINICNNILANIDNLLPANQDRVKSEALFIRAAVYYNLITLFAKPYADGKAATNLGVPLITQPTKAITGESLQARATVDQVYQQILADLTAAEPLLPTSNGVYATKWVAAALLSRVYLQRGEYALARDAANRVIGSGKYTLTKTFAAAFNNTANSSEDIFAMQINAQDGNNTMQGFWSVPDYGGRGDVEISQKHLDLYEPDDDRLALFFEADGAVRSGKWKEQFTVLPVFRLAEMYLTRAEGNFRLGTTIGDTPLNDVNAIRNRANLTSLTAGQLTLDAILKERKLELAHEGTAIQDLKRLKGSADGYAWDANVMVFPIPIREINTNKNLVQNDGY